MKKIVLICIMTLLCATHTTADEFNDNNTFAYEEDSSFNIGVKAGILGFGFDISKSINDFVSVRFNMNTLNYTTTDNSLYNKYISAGKTFNLDTKGVLLDFYLLQLRVTTGLYLNNNTITYKPKSGTAISLNGVDYDLDSFAKFESTISANKVSPYLGIGWGNNGSREGWGGWNLTLDIGLLYHGTPKLDVQTTINDAIPAPVQAVMRANIEAERKKQEKEISYSAFLPVVMVGLNYTF